MSPEEAARTYQFRDGFELVDYAEVGLPIFRLTIESITLAQRVLPTIHEFSMRSLGLGEGTSDDVARTLGLKGDVISAALASLVDEALITRVPNGLGETLFRLTDAGENRLHELVQEVPQEETIVIDYDATRRTPVRLAGDEVLKGAELRGYGAIEIRPYPSEPPPVTDLSVLDVSKVRRQYGDESRRTILALKRIARRGNLFREAVALVFAANKGREVQIAFAVGDRLSDPHEHAFAEHGGPKKMGFIKSVNATAWRRRLERFVGAELLKEMPEPEVLASARKEEVDAFAEVSSLAPAFSELRRRGQHGGEAADAFGAAQQRLLLAKHELNSFKVRPLACFEQSELLDEALARANQTLFISTVGIQPPILNGFRLRALDELADKGVSIRIETALNPPSTPRPDQYDPFFELIRRAEARKLELATVRRPFFFLIADGELAVISNRPFFGDSTRRTSFMRVEGLVTRDRRVIEHLESIAWPRNDNAGG